MGDDEDESLATISASLGSLDLTVEGEDQEWVSDTFDEKLDGLMDEAESMSRAVRDGTRGCQ